MGRFAALTTEQESKINELLELADKVLNTDKQVVALSCGSMGVSVLSSLSLAGITSGLLMFGSPLFFLGVAGMGYLLDKEKKKKEVQKQQNYMHEITLKMAKLEEQHRFKEEELLKQNKLLKEVERQQREKLEEYECVNKALVKVVEELQKNLSYA